MSRRSEIRKIGRVRQVITGRWIGSRGVSICDLAGIKGMRSKGKETGRVKVLWEGLLGLGTKELD